MVNTCGYVIAYAQYSGKSRDFLEYAKKRQNRNLLHLRTIEPPIKLSVPQETFASNLEFFADTLSYVYLNTDPLENDYTSDILSGCRKTNIISLFSLLRQIFRSDLIWALEKAGDRIEEFTQEWALELKQDGENEAYIQKEIESVKEIRADFERLKTLIITENCP